MKMVLVDIRVTMSWFNELNPSARGMGSKFSYPSHRLRLDKKRSTEPQKAFRRRINAPTEISPKAFELALS